jgi:hypothetical protein
MTSTVPIMLPDHVHDCGVIAHLCGRYLHCSWVQYALVVSATDMECYPRIPICSMVLTSAGLNRKACDHLDIIIRIGKIHHVTVSLTRAPNFARHRIP